MSLMLFDIPDPMFLVQVLKYFQIHGKQFLADGWKTRNCALISAVFVYRKYSFHNGL